MTARLMAGWSERQTTTFAQIPLAGGVTIERSDLSIWFSLSERRFDDLCTAAAAWFMSTHQA
jgi:hypothetical protein